jgi:hypothetical protein
VTDATQFETSRTTRLFLSPPFPATSPTYSCTNDQTRSDYLPYDYEGVSSGTIGFTRATALIRVLTQHYRDTTALPLRSLVANDLRRWEVQVDRGMDRSEHHQIYAVTIGSKGLILELGSPIDALSYPCRSLCQFI